MSAQANCAASHNEQEASSAVERIAYSVIVCFATLTMVKLMNERLGCMPCILVILLPPLGIILVGLGISACITYCGCKPLTNVDDARADLEREIEKKPRRFYMQAPPQQVIIPP